MENRKFYARITGVSALLVLLISIQSFWLYHAAQIDQRESARKINHALKAVAETLQNSHYDASASGKLYMDGHDALYLLHQRWNSSGLYSPPDTVDVFVSGICGPGAVVQGKEIGVGKPAVAELTIKLKSRERDPANFLREKKDFEKNIAGKPADNNVIDTRPAPEVFNMPVIDSLIKFHLKAEHIYAEYGYGIISDNPNRIALASRVTDSLSVLNSAYSVLLFADDVFSRQYTLALVFKHSLTNNSLTWWLLLSIAIILLLSAYFLFFVRFHLRQGKLSEMKSEFIHNLTHEFNTPMANIALAVETLRRENPAINEDENRILNIISSETARLGENIERALLVAKMEKGKLQLFKEPTDLVAMINTIMSAYHLRCEQLNGQITFHHPQSVTFNGDETHLLNCVCNILDNSIKYRKGSPVITIGLEESDEAVTLSVEDNGIGMSDEVQKNIFEKFYRAGHGARHNTKGFGLGLPYVQGIVSLHNGKITVWSKQGTGTVFTITLFKKARA